jgi:hypothetical protein
VFGRRAVAHFDLPQLHRVLNDQAAALEAARHARRVFKLLKWSLIPFLLSFLFRRSKPD